MDRLATPPTDLRARATDTLCRATGAQLCVDATLLWNAPARIRTGGNTGDAGGDHGNYRLVRAGQRASGVDDGALLRMGVLCNGTQLGYLENELNPSHLTKIPDPFPRNSAPSWGTVRSPARSARLA